MGRMSRRGLLVGLACASGVGAAPARISPGRFFKGDVLAALEQCADAAVKQGAPMWIDRDYVFGGVWRPPSGLILRGDFSNQARLVARDGIEVTGAIDLDGIVVDGGQTSPDRSAGQPRALLSIHGALGAGRSRYLANVKVGRVRVRRSRGAGLVLANLDRPTFGLVEIEDIYCHGSIWSGLRNARLDHLSCRNAGDLLASGGRRGSAMLIASETKPTAGWYTPDTARAMLPTEGFEIGSVDVERVTDSAFYSHDDFNTGVHGVHAQTISVRMAGKDGVKFRAGPSRIRLGQLRVSQVGGVGLSLDGVSDVQVSSVEVAGYGLDTVSRIIGRPAQYSRKGGLGQSISDAPLGIAIDNSRNVSVDRFAVSDGHFSPDRHHEGHGLRVTTSSGVRARGSVSDVDGNAARISGVTDFDIDVDCADVAGGAFRVDVLVSADRGPSSNGRIRVKRRDGARGNTTGLRVADQSQNITATLVGDVTTKVARNATVAIRRE